ncbi:MAG: hypothetical protein R3F37_10510 [Candidatus Competibacteraceae bacterium]
MTGKRRLWRAFLDDVKTEVEAIDNFPEQTGTPHRQATGAHRPAVPSQTGPMAENDLKAYAEI